MIAKQIERVAVETATQTVRHKIDSSDPRRRHCLQKDLHDKTRCDEN